MNEYFTTRSTGVVEIIHDRGIARSNCSCAEERIFYVLIDLQKEEPVTFFTDDHPDTYVTRKCSIVV
jgi:redox-regulated HSP33 family molecular chaperone